MKMKTNVQYIANATFAKLPDVACNRRTTVLNINIRPKDKHFFGKAVWLFLAKIKRGATNRTKPTLLHHI
jgi:hypothetical protein